MSRLSFFDVTPFGCHFSFRLFHFRLPPPIARFSFHAFLMRAPPRNMRTRNGAARAAKRDVTHAVDYAFAAAFAIARRHDARPLFRCRLIRLALFFRFMPIAIFFRHFITLRRERSRGYGMNARDAMLNAMRRQPAREAAQELCARRCRPPVEACRPSVRPPAAVLCHKDGRRVCRLIIRLISEDTRTTPHSNSRQRDTQRRCRRPVREGGRAMMVMLLLRADGSCCRQHAPSSTRQGVINGEDKRHRSSVCACVDNGKTHHSPRR